MVYLIDCDEATHAEVREAFGSEEVIASPDWTTLGSRLALADPSSDLLVLATCRTGVSGESLWRLLGHDVSGVPTVLWSGQGGRRAISTRAIAVPKAEGAAGLRRAAAQVREHHALGA